MSLKELAHHLRIEEELRMQDETQKHVSKIHVIEDRELSREQKRNNKRPNKDNNNKDNEKANAGC